jgi:hypothetical protein
MAKYALVFHGGDHAKSPEEEAQVVQAWRTWFESLGSAVVDPGNPVGMSQTLHPDGTVTQDGGANPISGISFISASSDADAVEKARGCPILEVGGSIEIAEVVELM